jgi:hypothetical protein
VASMFQPSTLRMLICPEASSDETSATVKNPPRADQHGIELQGYESATGEVMGERLVDGRALKLEVIEILGERQLGGIAPARAALRGAMEGEDIGV